jgi:hypothetical protein
VSKNHSLNVDLQLEVQGLKRRVMELEAQLAVRTELKDEAMQRYVSDSIAAWNAAIRSCGKPKPGESEAQYKARLLAYGKK